MKRIFYITTAVLLLVGCRQSETKQAYVPEGSFGMEEIAAIAQDTTHYRALIFTSPYCYGCRQMNEEIQNAVNAMDTSLWRIYYLIVEDIVDSAHWEEVVGDMMDMGIPRELIHHCHLPFEKGMYKEVVALFHTAQPIDSRSRMEGVPFCLAVDTNNYIPVTREKPSPGLSQLVRGRWPVLVLATTSASTPRKGRHDASPSMTAVPHQQPQQKTEQS